MHHVIKSWALYTVTAQIALAAINRGLRSNPKSPLTSATISLQLVHTTTISWDLVNLRLGFLPLYQRSLPVRKCSKIPLQMRGKSCSWPIIISFLTTWCSTGSRQWGRYPYTKYQWDCCVIFHFPTWIRLTNLRIPSQPSSSLWDWVTSSQP
jgi:hypothetical protein